MNKAQWSAIYNYCAEYGYDAPRDILTELKENGTVPQSTKLSELSDYVSGTTFDDMFQFLGDNL